MGQDTGTMHLFPNPVLTELTYKKKNKKAWLLSFYFPNCRTQHCHARGGRLVSGLPAAASSSHACAAPCSSMIQPRPEGPLAVRTLWWWLFFTFVFLKINSKGWYREEGKGVLVKEISLNRWECNATKPVNPWTCEPQSIVAPLSLLTTGYHAQK